MNFKKNTIIALTLINFTFLKAQQQFYPFTYENKNGLADNKGNEIVAPVYDYWHESEDKKFLIFSPKYDDKKGFTLCFDVNKGQGKKFKRFYEDEVTVQKVQHHFVEELSGEKYLLNSETGAIIPFKEDVYTLNDLNDDYIIAKYFSKDTKSPKITLEEAPWTKVKGKIPPPPAPLKAPNSTAEQTADNYIIYNSTNALEPVLKIKANNYFLLNKEIPGNKPDKDGNVVVQIIQKNLNDFDFIVFENNGVYELYNKNFKLIKKFISKPSSENYINEEALKKCEAFSGSSIEKDRGGYPSIGMLSGSKREEPKFVIQSENSVYYLVRNINDEKVKILSSYYPLEYGNDGEIRIEDNENDKTTSFKFDENSLRMYIPQKYLQKLGVKILKN